MNPLVDALNNALEEAPLSNEARKDLPNSAFAIPKKRKYPIHDENHARNALARVSKFGTEAEKEEVRAAVAQRYPDLNKKNESKDDETIVAIRVRGEGAKQFEGFMRKVAGFCNGGSSRYLAVIDDGGGSVQVETVGRAEEGKEKLRWGFDGDGNTRIAVGVPTGEMKDVQSIFESAQLFKLKPDDAVPTLLIDGNVAMADPCYFIPGWPTRDTKGLSLDLTSRPDGMQPEGIAVDSGQLATFDWKQARKLFNLNPVPFKRVQESADEHDMNSPEEKREVEIAYKLIALRSSMSSKDAILTEIEKLGKEILSIHGFKAE